MLEKDMNDLRGKIVSFAFHVEDMLNSSLSALKIKEIKELHRIIEKKEKQANSFETNIEKRCIATIAQFGPKAANLRAIIMILKMNNDLERIADHCVNICYSFIVLIDNQLKNVMVNDIEKISKLVISMYTDAVQSFLGQDSGLAERVCNRDRFVNNFRNKKQKQLKKLIGKDSSAIDISLELIKIYNKFERIADLSTNIAEYAVFISSGKSIRHNTKRYLWK